MKRATPVRPADRAPITSPRRSAPEVVLRVGTETLEIEAWADAYVRLLLRDTTVAEVESSPSRTDAPPN